MGVAYRPFPSHGAWLSCLCIVRRLDESENAPFRTWFPVLPALPVERGCFLGEIQFLAKRDQVRIVAARVYGSRRNFSKRLPADSCDGAFGRLVGLLFMCVFGKIGWLVGNCVCVCACECACVCTLSVFRYRATPCETSEKCLHPTYAKTPQLTVSDIDLAAGSDGQRFVLISPVCVYVCVCMCMYSEGKSVSRARSGFWAKAKRNNKCDVVSMWEQVKIRNANRERARRCEAKARCISTQQSSYQRTSPRVGMVVQTVPHPFALLLSNANGTRGSFSTGASQ